MDDKKTSMELINKELVLLDLKVETKAEVIKKIADLLGKEQRLSDKALYMEDVYRREEIGSTAIGDSIAMPHALSKAVKNTSLVFIRLNSEIEWNNVDKVKYIFGIAVPKDNKNNEHLKILSMIARNMLDADFKECIFSTNSKEEILSKLNFESQ